MSLRIMSPFRATIVRPLLAAAAVAGLSAGLSACSTTTPAADPGPPKLSEIQDRIRVSTVKKFMVVRFAPGAVSPDAGQIETMNVMMANRDLNRGDEVLIDLSTGGLAESRARALADTLSRDGLRPAIGAPQGPPTDELRLTINHTYASVVGCPDWSSAPGNNFDNTLHSDFGCSTEANLVAMVADPHDLETGRPLAPAVGEAAIAPVIRYREGKTKPVPTVSASQGVAGASASSGGSQ